MGSSLPGAVRVQDTGVGISETFLPELYEAFKQESDGHGRGTAADPRPPHHTPTQQSRFGFSQS